MLFIIIRFVKADKGNTTVIISTDNLHNKVQNFMKENNIMELKHDPTDKYQNTVKQLIKIAKHLITNKQKPLSLIHISTIPSFLVVSIK